MKKLLFVLCFVSIGNSFAAQPQPATITQPPQSGIYFNANGKYAGTTQTVNGSTSYYKNGQYQGQAPTNNSLFLNQNGQINQVSKP